LGEVGKGEKDATSSEEKKGGRENNRRMSTALKQTHIRFRPYQSKGERRLGLVGGDFNRGFHGGKGEEQGKGGGKKVQGPGVRPKMFAYIVEVLDAVEIFYSESYP